ncbi:Protein of unknown function, partial [Gryllus bimaculatus]
MRGHTRSERNMKSLSSVQTSTCSVSARERSLYLEFWLVPHDFGLRVGRCRAAATTARQNALSDRSRKRHTSSQGCDIGGSCVYQFIITTSKLCVWILLIHQQNNENLQVGSSVSSTTSKILETLRTAETPLVEEESGVSLTDGLMSSEASSQTGGEERGRAAPAVGVVRLRDLLLGEREVQAPVARSSSPRRRPALAARSSARTAPLPHGGR